MRKTRQRPAHAVKERRIETLIQDQALVQERHEQIFKAASRVFISHGYDRATVRQIAEEAGLSLGSLYTYIKSKEDILYLVFDKLTAERRANIARAIEGLDDPVARIEAAIRAHLDTAYRFQDEILLMYRETASLTPVSQHTVLKRESDYIAFFEEILQPGFDKGVFRGDRRLAADAIPYLCAIVALRRWSLQRRMTDEAATAGVVAFILRGLGVPEDRLPAPAAKEA
jgi:AcrR family transcriptional regulator